MLTNRDVTRLQPGTIVIVDNADHDAVRATVAVFNGMDEVWQQPAATADEIVAGVFYPLLVNTIEYGPMSQSDLYHLAEETQLVEDALKRSRKAIEDAKRRVTEEAQKAARFEQRLAEIKKQQRADARAAKKAATAQQFPCPKCKAPQTPGSLVCLECGTVFESA